MGSAAYAGIPITYHGGGDTLTMIRGFEDERREKPRIDWTSLATGSAATLIFSPL